jgi:hypothetical protein
MTSQARQALERVLVLSQQLLADRLVLKDVSEMNDRAIGLMEHHRRRHERALDMAAVGRRAVAAYSTTRLQR